ncbi:hypothetical protein QE382_002483 [Sphingobacterium zeae]|uniref:Uncharacterized protein n=2 Tax=Sphingobacterium zeae TaxID=1776859 RepID=A0ABU0U6E5_9SPHI|nr:hypothetical protein [Sphingobacterium zeae]
MHLVGRIHLFRYSGGFYNLFETIEVINSKKLDDTIEAFLLRKFENEPYIYNLPKICKESLVYLVRKRPEFLERIISLETFLNSNDEIIRLLAKHLDLKNFKMIEKFLEDHRSSWRMERMISLSKLELENDKKNPIYIYINKNYPVKTPKVLKSSKSIIQKSKLEEFRRFYLDYEDYYSPELIPFLVHNFEELERQLIESDLKYVKHVLVMILENYNPDNFRIIIDEVSKNRITFSLNQETWFQIELYFNAAYLIGETGLIMQHRDKLLKTLPRIDVSEYQQKDVLQNIIRLIAPITTEDEGIIYNFCIKRTDDMLALSSHTLAEVAIHFKLHLLNPVLLMLIENQKIQIFEKEEVLRAFGSLSKGENDYNALKRIVKLRKYDSSLKDIANAALITNYQDRNAIIWRFNELQKRLRPFDMDFRYNGARPVSEFEREMDRPEFPKCFYGIINDLIYNNMLNLLTFSFSIRNDKLKVRYSNYLQQIVYNYFKTFINTKVLADLKKTVSQFPEVSQTYSFNFHIDELIKDFSSQSKKQEPFITAVHSLNHILKKIYLPVNSNAELREIILNVVNTDIKNLIENEGFYKLAGEVNEKKVGEVTIQKTLKIALEKALMDRGLRKSDIFREVESYDGLKYDYLKYKVSLTL